MKLGDVDPGRYFVKDYNIEHFTEDYVTVQFHIICTWSICYKAENYVCEYNDIPLERKI